MSNPNPRPSPMSGNVGSFAGSWYKCPNPQCPIVDLRDGAIVWIDGRNTCPDCGAEVRRAKKGE